MRDATELAVNMVCRYTDPDGNQFDAIIESIEGEQAWIRLRSGFLTKTQWVDVSTLSVPR